MKVDLLYGPPGTGKTHNLMDILDFEINTKNVDVSKIAYVTFTKKGADEGINRTSEKFNIPKNKLTHFRTLHSMAFRELEMSRAAMMCAKYYYDFSKKVGFSFSGYYSEELSNGDDKYLFAADLYRNNKDASRLLIETLDREKFLFIMKQYYRYKETFGYCDYTDLIQRFVNLKITIPVEVAIIDEAQDLTTLQWQMVWTAFADCKRVYIAGDDDQSIYQWSGADVNYFLNVHGNQTVLHESWRLPQKLVDYSKRITKQISTRVDKTYVGQDKPGNVIYVNSLKEISIDKEKSYLCLSRNNTFLSRYEEWLTDKMLPYLKKGEAIASLRDLEAIKFYENIRKTRYMTDTDEYKLSRIRKPNTDLKDPWYDAFDWPAHKITLIRKLIEAKQITTKPKINVATIHSVKGGEADNVILMEDITQPVYEQLDRDPDSEHRVFYVGATRAKENLIIVKAQSEYKYNL